LSQLVVALVAEDESRSNARPRRRAREVRERAELLVDAQAVVD
jgi:hypothetical protein